MNPARPPFIPWSGCQIVTVEIRGNRTGISNRNMEEKGRPQRKKLASSIGAHRVVKQISLSHIDAHRVVRPDDAAKSRRHQLDCLVYFKIAKHSIYTTAWRSDLPRKKVYWKKCRPTYRCVTYCDQISLVPTAADRIVRRDDATNSATPIKYFGAN